MPENPTLEDLRADAADYLKYAGPLSDDVHTEHTYFTSPTAIFMQSFIVLRTLNLMLLHLFTSMAVVGYLVGRFAMPHR